MNCSNPTLLEVGSLILPHIVEIACHSFASHVLELFIMKLVREIYTNGKNIFILISIQINKVTIAEFL